MLPTGSSCFAIVGCVVDMQNQYPPYYPGRQPGTNTGGPLTGDYLKYAWSYHNTSSTYDTIGLVPNVLADPCEYPHSKIVYTLTIGTETSGDTFLTARLVVRTYIYASGGVSIYDGVLSFTTTIALDTDLTAISGLYLTYESSGSTECMECDSGASPPDLTGMSLTITAL
jgi:hypothetical protein